MHDRLMARGLLLITLSISSICAMGQGADPLAQLREIIGDETAAVDALLRFDAAQQALVTWDLDMAQERLAAGDKEAAETKQLDAQRRLQTIRAAYELVLDQYRNNGRALNGYGELLFHRYNDHTGALMRWKQAATAGDDEPLSRCNLANYYGHTGDYDLMIKYLDEALEIDDEHPDVLFYATQIYLIHFPQIERIKEWDREKIFKKAMAMSKKAADLFPNDHQLQEDYAVNFYAAENFGVEADWRAAAEAWKRTQSAAYAKDDIYYAWLNLARVYTVVGEWELADAAVDKALEIHPENPSAKRVKEMIGNREPTFKTGTS